MNEVISNSSCNLFVAPTTVIGGIFGMNFDIIPLHNKWDFYIGGAHAFAFAMVRSF
jgi:magnesium transporter